MLYQYLTFKKKYDLFPPLQPNCEWFNSLKSCNLNTFDTKYSIHKDQTVQLLTTWKKAKIHKITHKWKQFCLQTNFSSFYTISYFDFNQLVAK